MKKNITLCLLLIHGLVLASPGEATKTAEPVVVIESLLKAMDANDGKQIRALFAEDASQAYGEGRAKSGERFFRWLESDIISRKGRVDTPKLTVQGDQVIVRGTYQSRGYSSAADFLFTVEDGRITSWRMRY